MKEKINRDNMYSLEIVHISCNEIVTTCLHSTQYAIDSYNYN